MSSEEIKDQHFLPACYLDGFTNKTGKLYALDLTWFIKRGSKPVIKSFSPGSICHEEHFYTLTEEMARYNVNGVEDKYAVEKGFYTYENIYKSLVAKVAGGKPLKRHDAEILIRTLIDLKFRNKFYRDHFIGGRQIELVDGTFDQIKTAILNDPAYLAAFGDVDPQLLLQLNEDVRQRYLNDPEFKKHTHLSSIYRKDDAYGLVVEGLVNKLLWVPWRIYRSANLFLGTDNPGFSMDEHSKLHNTYFKKKFIFHFPLNDSLCLVIADPFPDMQFLTDQTVKHYLTETMDESVVHDINKMSLFHFTNLLYSPDRSLLEDIIPLIKRKES
ncbi:DUF4238 domain-containing protein [Mucilaginibacter sp.]|uniref:DUF4238 domain-containing protein n=1 Tax=Mucilaginibacter sp. TaxID=1882438 RepID=UPI0026067EAB|nr:DUF4238 domain-containing protein [Mucilaginibacter sp.]MDB5128344.1 hypothetical protein [Mucilaginibacter sp.]